MTQNRFPLAQGSSQGSVLLYVVWAIALLSLFAAAIGSQAIASLGRVDRLSEQWRASHLARGAAQYAASELKADETQQVDGLSDSWVNDPGRFRDHPLGEGRFRVMASLATDGPLRYGLTDEERYLSLNAAPTEMLQRFFEVVGGLHEDEAIQIADAIEDWRDSDDRESPRGAEGSYYRSLSDGYDCKNGPFENLEELLLIRGVTPELYRRVAPHLTVYGSGRLNVNTADDHALDALGLSALGVAGVVAFRAGEDGQEGTGDDRRLVSLAGLQSELAAFVPVEDLARLDQRSRDQVLGVGSTDFRMVIEADTGRAISRVTAMCVMGRDGVVKLWTEQ